MPDSSDLPRPAAGAQDAARRSQLAEALVKAQHSRVPISPPGLQDQAAARAVRDLVLAEHLAGGDHHLGFRALGDVDAVLTTGMQFPADLVLPGDRLIAGAARPALAFRVARAIEPDTPPAEMPPALGAIALAIDIADSRYAAAGEATMADRLADNDGAAAFVIGPWRAITGSFAECQLVLEVGGQGTVAALFADPVAAALALAARRQREGERIAEGSVLLLVAAVSPLAVAPGIHLVLAAPEVGTITAEISG